MTAIILAGGKSSRMGRDKAFMKIGRTNLIKRELEILRKIFKEILIVANKPKKYRFSRNVKVMKDIIPNLGPLGGLYSGLKASDTKYNFVAGCDMPFLNPDLIRYMMKSKKNYDVVVPKANGRMHPLFGIYSKKCIPAIEENLKEGRRNVSSIFPKMRTKVVSGKDIVPLDNKMYSLMNINTPDDLKVAKRIERRQMHGRSANRTET